MPTSGGLINLDVLSFGPYPSIMSSPTPSPKCKMSQTDSTPQPFSSPTPKGPIYMYIYTVPCTNNVSGRTYRSCNVTFCQIDTGRSLGKLLTYNSITGIKHNQEYVAMVTGVNWVVALNTCSPVIHLKTSKSSILYMHKKIIMFRSLSKK